jgi:hypothetical protein
MAARHSTRSHKSLKYNGMQERLIIAGRPRPSGAGEKLNDKALGA